MVLITALFSTLLALVFSAEASPTRTTPMRTRSLPMHMNREEARALATTYGSTSLHTRDENLCNKITLDQLNKMPDAVQDAKVCFLPPLG